MPAGRDVAAAQLPKNRKSTPGLMALDKGVPTGDANGRTP